MRKILPILLLVIAFADIQAQSQTDAEYVNSLIGVGINGQRIIDEGVSAWPDAYYQQIADAGFESVRIVYEPGQTLYTITNSTLVLLKSIVDKCISYGLFPVIDYHITPLWFINNYSAAQGQIFVDNLGAMADYFKGYDYDELVLELVNEPNYISASTWNALLASAITKIRTYDADRVIMVSPLYYSHIEGLRELTLPADDNLILSIHYYNPGWIYLQNCPWTNPDLNGEGYAGMTWRNIQPFVDNLEEEFKYVRDFQADNNNIPVNIGEWGSVIYGDTANRRLYYTMLSNWFTDQGYSHMVWEYDRYFGIMQNRAATKYGSETREWYPGFPEAITSDPLILYEYDSTDLVVGNFSSTAGWSTYEANGGDISISVSSGELVINVANGGTGYLDARLFTPALDMYKDSIYRISYTIRTGSGTKTYAHKEAGYNTWYYIYDLDTSNRTVVETIVRDSTNAGTYYEFMLGGSTGTLYMSNFRIEKITASDTPVEAVTDTCDAHITVYDTISTTDSVGWYFNNNLTAAYGDYTLTASGDLQYTYAWACEGSYQLHESTERLYTNSAISLADSFHVKLCYGTFTTSSWKTLIGNKALSGSGWLLQRGDNGRLVFITENASGDKDSSFTANGTVGTIYDQDNYQIEIIVNRADGYASILVDGVYATAADSSIRTDFNTYSEVSIYDDAGEGSKAWSYLDKIELKWIGETVSVSDSCVQYTDFNLFDTLHSWMANDMYGVSVLQSASGDCGADSMATIADDNGYLVYYGIEFDSVVNRLYIAVDGDPTNDSYIEIRLDSPNGIKITEHKPKESGCYIYEKTIANITGTHDIYVVLNKVDFNKTFYYMFFDYEQPTYSGFYRRLPGWKILNNWKILR